MRLYHRRVRHFHTRSDASTVSSMIRRNILKPPIECRGPVATPLSSGTSSPPMARRPAALREPVSPALGRAFILDEPCSSPSGLGDFRFSCPLEDPSGAWTHVLHEVFTGSCGHLGLTCGLIDHRGPRDDRTKPPIGEAQSVRGAQREDVEVAPVWQHQRHSLNPWRGNNLRQTELIAEQERALLLSPSLHPLLPETVLQLG